MRKGKFLTVASLIGLLFLATPNAEAGVKVNTGIDRPVIVEGLGEEVVVKVGILAQNPIKSTKRLPLNISVVLDKSGSMGSADKMENAKRGAIEVIQNLTAGDIFSLIVYDSSARVVIPAQLVKDKQALIQQVRNIYSGGNTALYDGVSFGASEIRKNITKEYINKIVLLSDGLANRGPSSTEDLAELGRQLSRESISVSTIGVGLDYNEDLMTSLAEESSGNTYFAKNSDVLPDIFTAEIGESMTLTAQDVVIRLECNDAVLPVSFIGRKGEIMGKNMQTEIKQLFAYNEKYVLFQVKAPKGAHGQTKQLAKVIVEYRDPYTQKTVKQDSEIRISYDKSQKAVEKNLDKDIVKQVALTQVSKRKQKAISYADKGDYKQASKILSENKTLLEKTAKQCDNDKELLDEALKNETRSREVKSGGGFSSFLRKLTVNEASTQTKQQYTPGAW